MEILPIIIKGKKAGKAHTTPKCVELQSYFPSPNKELLKEVIANREGFG